MNLTRVMKSGRFGLFACLMLLTTSWAGMATIQENQLMEKESPSWSSDIWNETPFRDVGVPENFTFLSYINYSDVGVLINNQSDVSRTIGYAFVAARNISQNRIFLFDNESTPTGETINPDQFDDYFAEPLRNMIADRNLTTELNYLVTTKGIPLRINGPGNGRASFDSEIGLINGAYNSTIHQNWWASHSYGPGANEEMKEFSRQEEGFYLVTRLTGYTVDTALGLIDKANNSFGQRGLGVLDLATNRNGSGYKWWNDMLYVANTTLNGTMGLPVHFNQNSTFVTNQSDVMFYASWGSNDGSWNSNWLPNSGFDTQDSAWVSDSRYWDYDLPPLVGGEDMTWQRQTSVKRNGNAALEGAFESAPCSITEANTTQGLLAEYFDNAGITFNRSTMPDLIGRTPDYIRPEALIDTPQSTSAWSGLDDRFKDYWSVRHSGAIDIPQAGNWTFYLNSDDGAILWLDDIEIVNNQGEHGITERAGTAWLDAGLHDLKNEFFEHGGWAGLTLSWEGPNQTKQVVPSSAFYRGTGDEVRANELVHKWSFDEGTGTTFGDSVGDANMTLYNSNNGSAWQNCLFGNCYSFDGNDDYAKVDVTDWGGNFSLSLWVNTANYSQSQFSSALAVNDVGGDSASFQIMTSGGSPGEWQIYHNVSYTFGEIHADEWTHLAVTYANNTLTQYIDGENVATTVVPNATIDSIELYKLAVNRAGNTYFEGTIDELKIWNTTLLDSDIVDLFLQAATTCDLYSAAGVGETAVKQTYDFEDELKGHAWIVYGYGMRSEDMIGDYRIEVDSFDGSGTYLSTNTSSTQSLTTSWNSRTMRFRPPENASSFEIRMVGELGNIRMDGSIYFDTMNLRAIRPHFEWEDGAIAETAVSTGGRTFNWGATYGQSLVVDLLEDGVSGVKGYVYEPYLSAVGYPSVVLPYYAYGYNLAEVHYAANPMVSWMGVVIGDPKMAPYADILHDVEVEAVRTDGRLSVGVNGSIDVVVQNLAPGIVNGTLEVRDRNGNSVLANVSLQMPGGDQTGSRRIVSLNLTPTRTGFNEYVVRYIAGNWSNPERVTDNNYATLNLEVNEPPEITNFVCSSWTAHRGDTVGCDVFTSDDSLVSQVRLGWRLNDSGSDWNFINATSTDMIEWYVALTIPIEIELGTIDLVAEIRDEQFQYTLRYLNGSITITNAPHTWFGTYFEGVDDPTWNGVTSLPPRADGEVVRDSDIVLKACVIDADHDGSTELPMLITNKGNVTGVIQTNSPFSDVYCYEATWRMDWGEEVSESTIYLYDSVGNLFTTRIVDIHDELFEVEFNLTDFDGLSHAVALGTGERLVISISDSDDFLTNYQYTISVSWPGHSTYEETGQFTPELGTNSQFVITLPPPEAGLEFGDLEIEFEIDDLADGGDTQIFNANWSVHIQPPLVAEIGFCEENTLPLVRGERIHGWATIQPNRIVERVAVTLAQSGNVKPMQQSQFEIDGCSFPDDGWLHWGFTLEADNSFTEGNATLQIIATDLDGIGGNSEFPIQIDFGLPIILNQTGEVIENELGELKATIFDPDGHTGSSCTFIIVDQNGTNVMESEEPLSPDGVFTARWMPPLVGAPFTSTIGCTDAEGHQVAHTRTNITPSKAEQEVNQTTDGNVDQQNQYQVADYTLQIIGAVLSILILIGVTIGALYLKRNQEDEFEEEIRPELGWAAPSDSLSEGLHNVALSEMARSTGAEVQSQSETFQEVNEVLQSDSHEPNEAVLDPHGQESLNPSSEESLERPAQEGFAPPGEGTSELDWIDESSLFEGTDEPKY